MLFAFGFCRRQALLALEQIWKDQGQQCWSVNNSGGIFQKYFVSKVQCLN